MKKNSLVTLFLLLFSLLFFYGNASDFVIAQTEVAYPDVGGGTIPPQELQNEGIEPSLWPSYFASYVFRVLFLFSFFIITLVLLYGSILYILSLPSSNKSIKIKSAKEWMGGAVQGALVISLSLVILSSIGNQFVLFRQINITEIRHQHTPLTLDWSLSNQYFQIPFGSIIEKAVINNDGKKDIYSIFIKAKQVEKTAYKLEEVSEELLKALSLCSTNKECDAVFSLKPGPEDPSNRPEKINIFADPINLITAKSYLNNDIYNFIDTSHDDFVLPINSWQQGDVILGGPNAMGGISSNDFNAINGSAIRLFGEDRITTEMALRLAIRHNNKDKDYGYLDINYLNDSKITANFKWHDDVLKLNKCPENTIFSSVGTGRIVVNPIFNVNNAHGKGFVNIFVEERSILCLQDIDSIWLKNQNNEWELRCTKKDKNYIDNILSFYKNNINYVYCPQEYVCENNICTCIEEGLFCTDTNKSCLQDVDCRGTMHYVNQNGWINYTSLMPSSIKNSCPNLNYIIEELIAEAEYYENIFLAELEDLYNTQNLIEDNLYNLLKATILKSLIFESSSHKDLLLSYISFDFDRNYYKRDKNDTSVITYDNSHYNEDYYAKGGTDWSKWVDGSKPNIEYIPHHNDPITFYLKMDLLDSSLPGTTNNIINSAFDIALRLKEEGIQYAGDRAGLDEIFPPPPVDTFDILFPPVDPSKTRVSSFYGWRSSPRIGYHRGIDFARKDYRTTNYPIYAVEDGIVKFAGRLGNYGNLIIIEHFNDDIEYLEEDIQSYYGHLRSNSLKVVTGDRVERGEHIAFMGSTGFSTGIHLHFEIRESKNNSFPWGTQVNPFLTSENYNNKEYLNSDWWASSAYSFSEATIKDNLLNNFSYLLLSLNDVFHNIFTSYVLAENDINTEMVENIILCIENEIELSNEELPLNLNLCKEKIEICTDKINVSQEKLLNYLEDNVVLWEDILLSCEIDVNNTFIEDGSRLTCGNEIPVGEAFELTWEYLVEVLEKINIYVGEGQELLKYIRAINNLISSCDCLCECNCYNNTECFNCCKLNACPLETTMELTNIECSRDSDCDSNICNIMSEEEIGFCVKEIDCCFQDEIKKNKEAITYIRNIMSNTLYSQLEALSHGFYNKETENICEPTNIDIRGYGINSDENTICATLKEKNITKHELIKRKLYLSRKMFDDCKISDLEGALLGEKQFKTTVFGPLAENRNLQRITKQNETTINVCCCPEEVVGEENYNLCPIGRPNQINTLACTANERSRGCETITKKIQQNTSNYNWFCCSGVINN